MFVSTHYAGPEVIMAFKEGEAYKKVFGPVFVYLNSASRNVKSKSLWSDAVQQVNILLQPTTIYLLHFIRVKWSDYVMAHNLSLFLIWSISYPMKSKDGLMISLGQNITFHPINEEE